MHIMDEYQKTIKKFYARVRLVFLVETYSYVPGLYYQVISYSNSLKDVIVSNIYYYFDDALLIYNSFIHD